MKIGLVGFNCVDLTEFELSFLEEASELVLTTNANRKLAKYINDRQIPVTEIPANYREYKREARAVQNLALIEACDKVIFFWDIDMPLSEHLIRNCIKQKKPIIILPSVGW